MLRANDFWDKEKGAPLLRRNAEFLPKGEPLPAELADRVAAWPGLCGADAEVDPPLEPSAPDEAADRIFLRDAERTFADEGHRQRMIGLLGRVWPLTKDYHQGLGYIASLLLLLFDEETAFRMLLRIGRDDKYSPGYWHAAPDAYVRDAMVYARLAEEREPEVAALLQQACLVPEAYASKWLIGLCVHVLPFRALFDYVEAFLEHGHAFLFRFSLALLRRTKEKLLAFKPTDVNLILEVLRLDQCQYGDELEAESGWFSSLVAEAKEVELEAEQLQALRAEEAERLAEKQRRIREREAQMAAEESDDEIVFSDEEDD
mmetsp:Transcript_5661/g.16994  ORF Transcript_5661/g.16994 Transcript_5661/m.16994 type:complete len:317 (-) Transcript_5661:186-1136(-)